MSLTSNTIRTQPASDLVNLETYTRHQHLVVSKADGDKTYVGRAYCMSPLLGGGTEFAHVIRNVSRTLADDAVIQLSEICQPQHNLPALYLQGKTQGGPVVAGLLARQAQLLTQGLQCGLPGNTPQLNQRYLLLSLATPVRYLQPRVLESCQLVQEEFLNGIRGSGFVDAQPLSAGELLGYYRVFANIYAPHQPVLLDELLELKLQAFTPDLEMDFRERRVGRFGEDTFCAAVTLKAYPQQVSQGLMNCAIGAPLNSGSASEGGGHRMACPYIFSVCIRVANQRKELDRLEHAVKSRARTQELPFRLGNEDPRAALEDLLHLQKQCGKSDGEKIVYVSSTAFLFGKTPEAARASASDLKIHLDNLDCDARVCVHDTLVRWCQALPLNFAPAIADKLGSEAIMDSAAAGCLLPIYGEHPGNADTAPGSQHTGAVFVTRRGSAHFFDPFVTKSNANGFIASESGMGKSTCLQYLILNDLAEGCNVFLLDNGKSARKFCGAVAGEFNDLSFHSREALSLNPFSGLSYEEFQDTREGITDLLLLMCYEDEAVQPGARIAMSEAVEAAFGQKQFHTEIQTVVDSLAIIYEGLDKSSLTEVQSAARNLVPRLKAFIDSPTRGRFFKGQSTIDRSKQLTVFELGGLEGDKHLQRCVLFLTMNTLMTRIRQVPGRKKVYVDEAFDLLAIDTVAAALEAIYFKGRKYGVSIWIVVQSLLKLVSIPAGSVIMKQSAWKLILGQSAEEISKLFAIEDKPLAAHQDDAYFRKMLQSVTTVPGVFSEIMVINKDYFEVVRLYVDRFTGVMFSTSGAAFTTVLQRMDEGMGAIEAVHRFLGDKQAANQALLGDVLQVLREQSLTEAEIRALLAKALSP